MARKLGVFDFDHTLFRSEEFWDTLVAELEYLYGIDAKKFQAERLDRSPTGPGRVAGGEGYNVFVHLSSHYGITSATAKADLIPRLRRPGWLYSGAIELIANLQAQGFTVCVVTVGEDEFQEFKRACCPELPELSFRVVSQNKGVFLRGFWNHSGHLVYEGVEYHYVVVIDDCAGTHEALGHRPGLTCVQVVGRPKYPRACQLEWVRLVTRLEQVTPLVA